MHKNLVTKISLEPASNDMETLKGFQEIVSDYAFGTYYTIYGKFKGEHKEGDPDFFKMEEAVFYLQNFTGQVTVGLNSVYQEIDMAYYEDLEEAVYFINLFVQPLYYSPFFPSENQENINHQDEVLLEGKKLILAPLVLKKEGEEKLIINNFKASETNAVEKELKQHINNGDVTFNNHNGYLNLNYKIVFHIHYLPHLVNKNKSAEDLKSSIFLDEKNYERRGEEIIKKKSYFNNQQKDAHHISVLYPNIIRNAIDKVNGRIVYDKNCKSGITDGSKPKP